MGILSLIILIADIWAIVKTFQAPIAGDRKFLWSALILLLPVIGLVIWLLAGPVYGGTGRGTGSGTRRGGRGGGRGR